MIETVMFFLLGASVGFALGIFAGCMVSFAKTQEEDYQGDEHDHF